MNEPNRHHSLLLTLLARAIVSLSLVVAVVADTARILT